MNKLFTILLLLVWASSAFAQQEKQLTPAESNILAENTQSVSATAADPIIKKHVEPTDSAQTAKSEEHRKPEFSLMPYVSYNRTMGGMFGAIPMMMYHSSRNDTISPKSLLLGSAVWTTNKSWFTSIMNRNYFGHGKWRSVFVLLNGKKNASTSFNSTANGGNPFEADFSNRLIFVLGSIQYQVIPHLFAGVSTSFSNSRTDYSDEAETGFDSNGNPIQDASINIASLAFIANYDTRNNQYYPTSGINSKILWITNPEFMNDFTANRLNTEFNTYHAMRGGKDVLAARYFGAFGLGDIAFQQQRTIGGRDMRGYSSGKYRGNGVMDVQAEYRFNPFEKVGFVGFAGLATLYGSSIESYNWKAYPGGGVGVRYRAFKNTRFNIGLDAAVGKEDWGVYFRIGEAF
ncbi:MAG: hypothetical protein ACK5MI_06015 [Mangrovibacterium sp.]